MTQNQPYKGLTADEVAASRAKHGDNTLTPVTKESLWRKFFHKLEDPIVLILLVAGVLSLAVACYEYYGLGHSAAAFFEPLGILVAVVLATGIAFYFEWRAEQAFTVLNQVNDDEPVRVVREGSPMEVRRREVVVGDIVLIGAGDEVPADAELLEAVQLKVDEASLTGEPLCEKSTDSAHFDEEATFPTHQVMKGTKVMEGQGVARVLAVGDATEYGKVFEAAQIDAGVRTPLNEQLDALGATITKIGYLFAALIVVGRIGGYWYAGGSGEWSEVAAFVLQTLMIAVTLLVVSVPEGLPMAVTLSLAYSMRRMLRTNNLVRRLHACETMGATTLICTDKTGTLTQNQMRVHEMQLYGCGRAVVGQEGVAEQLFAEGIAVNATAALDLSSPDAPRPVGNPTEGALLLWLHGQGEEVAALQSAALALEVLPFSTERKYMATLVRSALTGKRMLYVKGAPEVVRSFCTETGGGVAAAAVDAQLRSYQEKAMRTLAFACRVVGEEEEVVRQGQWAIEGLTLMGIAAIADPVRAEVPTAIRTCLAAGIGVMIVTGDTVGTAKEIARQVGLWQEGDTEEQIITGPEFAALTDEELAARVRHLKIIARARPMDKKRLVETLQQLGEVVAVTGDGTNDAPALKAAHVGLSMGDGTAVAKEASDMTIIDSSFSSITRAVMWGRSLYQNIQRFLLFQLTVNVAACLIVLFGTFFGAKPPLTVTQMLWVNLIMDTFAAMALASLPPSEAVMQEPPRQRAAFIVSPAMRRLIFGVGGGFFLLLTALAMVFQQYEITSIWQLLTGQWTASAGGITPYESALFFSLFVFLQFWNLFNAKAFATGGSALRMKGCQGFVWIASLIVVGQVVIVSVGGAMFSVAPLSWADWAGVIGITAPVLLIGEGYRKMTALFT